jgi:drug/metabolite transporter (DMT)-like permease
MSPLNRAWLQMHFCVVLWGFTAILGRLITLEALPLVWWRMLLVSVALLLSRRCWSGIWRMERRLLGAFLGIGVLLALHWLTFYAAIKLANASVAVTCMALTPVVIALIGPALGGRRFDTRELVFGLLVIPGVVLVVGGTPSGMRWGVATGVASAVFIGIVSCLNKRFVERADPLSVTGLEMAAGVLFLPLIAPLLPGAETLLVWPNRQDILLLLVLAFACTLLPFVLSLVALRQLSAFSSALAVNMEPVYAILLAMLLFGEQRELAPSFYLGCALLLGVVFSQPLLMRAKLAPMLPNVNAPP